MLLQCRIILIPNKRFNIFKENPTACELKKENKKLREIEKLKRVSLVILRNENTKLLADIDDSKKNLQIKINKAEQDIQIINTQTRSIR